MGFKELDKVYDPTKVEDKWYTYWEEHKLFHGDETSKKKHYSIVIPPPNVTGMLTMGHILNNTIQDLLIRWKKMQGYETLWMPGTDHAGIATQNKVEAAIAEEGLDRHMLGREKFLERVWEWKEKYGGIIFKQLRHLGAACDWDRECFTMDENLSFAVKKVFVSLYDKGLIYRGRRLINWCPKCYTALADEEVDNVETEGKFWDLAYPLADGSGEIIVSTTRPETMLGDTAVAVHPEDERYKAMIGKKVRLPLIGREIPIIGDEHADPELGSGAVKITPAHDFNDFEVGHRHNLEQISVIDAHGKMNENAGHYNGLDRFEARKKILADLENLKLLRGERNKTVAIPKCYRSGDIVEPHLSDQWFVKMEPLAKPAIKVVREGQIKFHPKHWEETYFHWMENIRDWCISRQIWWGHRIPAWYCEHGHVTVSIDEPKACVECGSTNLEQEQDVLDTWFSSWLWPFSTLGWPDDTADLKKFFPTDTLATGPDIIFFWVARMIMASLEFMDDIPFKDVYFNGMIRDLSGKKMSKSLGNSPDPLWLINGVDGKDITAFSKVNPSYKKGVPAYGADAIRLTMVYLTPLGGDIKFDHTLIELGQKFTNKLWNASRFVLMNLDEDQPVLLLKDIPESNLEMADKWILSRLNRAIIEIEKSLHDFRMNDATHALYSFIWTEYCDWYIELIKSRLYDSENPEKQQVARSVAVYILDNIVRLLHPFMPFITEELWQNLPDVLHQESDVKSIMSQPYPKAETERIDASVEKDMTLLQQIIGAIRNIRGEMNVPPAKEADLIVLGASKAKQALIKSSSHSIQKLARVSHITFDNERPKLSATAVVQGMDIVVPLAELIDIEVEKSRLSKEIERIDKQLAGLSKKLSNRDFIARAPKDVIDKEKEKQENWQTSLKKLEENLQLLLQD